MIDPTRRNRNIGTSKQGHGKDNRLVIPQPAIYQQFFYERLEAHQKIIRPINGYEFTFLIEETRATSPHACSIEDVAAVIRHIPVQDYGDLRLIVFRQPKRKEEILRPVWGRFIQSFLYDGGESPAIVLESVDSTKKLTWPRKLTPEDLAELDRLKEDGHKFREEKRSYIADLKLEAVRNTQMFRTLPHEFGHYVHLLKTTRNPDLSAEDFVKIPHKEKETFAHRYATDLREKFRDGVFHSRAPVE